jgi:hypothetical protein
VALSRSTKAGHGKFFILFQPVAFGHGCHHPSYVRFMLKQFNFPATSLAGSVVCAATAYSNAVFTSENDDSVGGILPWSSGSPAEGENNYIGTSSGLNYCQFNYAGTAVTTICVGGGGNSTFNLGNPRLKHGVESANNNTCQTSVEAYNRNTAREDSDKPWE